MIFEFNEEHLSQIPAIKLLVNLEYKYIPLSKAFKERLGKFIEKRRYNFK